MIFLIPTLLLFTNNYSCFLNRSCAILYFLLVMQLFISVARSFSFVYSHFDKYDLKFHQLKDLISDFDGCSV